MTDIILKILRVVLWIIGFPIIIVVLGVFVWASCCIDFITE